jgi:site-specific DNA-methyltransferase (adenine-specific)
VSAETFLNGRIVLYLADCREVIPSVGVVDRVIFDPPYESHMHDAKVGARGIRTDGYASPAAVDFASIAGLREEITAPLVEMCQGWFIAFCTPEGIAPWRDVIEAAGARYKRACFWDKPDSAPQFNGQCPAMAVEAFVAAWCGAGHSRWNGGGRRNVFRHMTNQSDRHGIHPTEKPVSLMAEIISLFSDPHDLIFDPTMGSGTTGVACAKTGRRFIGVERDPSYFEICCERVDKACRQPDMFIEIPPEIKQEAMI